MKNPDATEIRDYVRERYGAIAEQAGDPVVSPGCGCLPAKGPATAGGEQAVEPGAAAEVEHGFAGLDRGQRERIAASQAEIRPLGNGSQVLGTIADLLADLVDDLLRSAT